MKVNSNYSDSYQLNKLLNSYASQKLSASKAEDSTQIVTAAGYQGSYSGSIPPVRDTIELSAEGTALQEKMSQIKTSMDDFSSLDLESISTDELMSKLQEIQDIFSDVPEDSEALTKVIHSDLSTLSETELKTIAANLQTDIEAHQAGMQGQGKGPNGVRPPGPPPGGKPPEGIENSEEILAALNQENGTDSEDIITALNQWLQNRTTTNQVTEE